MVLLVWFYHLELHQNLHQTTFSNFAVAIRGVICYFHKNLCQHIWNLKLYLWSAVVMIGTLCMQEEFFILLLSSADFFQHSIFPKIISGTLSECQTVWIQIRTDATSVLIWIQTVCKCYQQTTKVAASKERVNIIHYTQSLTQSLSKRQTVWLCRSWSGSKLFANVISRRQKSPLARKELISFITPKVWRSHYQSVKPFDYVGPDLGPNCLQMLSADDKSAACIKAINIQGQKIQSSLRMNLSIFYYF